MSADQDHTLLRCPHSRSALVQDAETLVCIDVECRRQFDIQSGIPVMLPDSSRVLSVDDWQAVMDRAEHGSKET